ncbi:hypothetical protein ACXYTP_03670 [Tsukamurella ocularis]|uniref:hypothetical protein n=1 Tax=Tsukamurella ocularis TaxID=1970234 RepID=UPI0039EFC53F
MSGRQGLSLGRLALFSVGAAVAVLGLCVLLLNVLRPGTGISLLIVAVGLFGAVAAMGVVSKAMVARAAADADDREPGKSDDTTH